MAENKFLMSERERLLAEAETVAGRIAKAIASVKALLDLKDADEIKAGLVEIIAFVEAPETARRIVETEAQIATQQAQLARLKASIQ